MVIRQFLDYLRYERNFSPQTLRSYGKDLRGFESYFKRLDNHLSWETLDSDVIRSWVESMMDKGNTATSIGRRLSALRSFYRFALMRKEVSFNPARSVKGPKKSKPLPQFVKEAEMDRLIDGTKMWDRKSFKDMRARTIIMTFYETGVRLSELSGLDDSAIDLAGHQLKVTGKGNKQRVIPFGEELHDILLEYMKMRDDGVGTESGALFVTLRGKRMNAGQVRYVVTKYLSMVSTLKKRSPHVLRHTFATAMLNNGAGMESVRKLLGHESLKTTEVYTHTTFEQLKRVYDETHPRS